MLLVCVNLSLTSSHIQGIFMIPYIHIANSSWNLLIGQNRGMSLSYLLYTDI